MDLQSLPRTVESCQACSEFFSLAYNRGRMQTGKSRACDLNERKRIKESKNQGCRLCGMIFKFLEESYGSQYDHENAQDEEFDIGLYVSRLNSDEKRKRLRFFSMISFNWASFDQTFSLFSIGRRNTCFSIWTDEDKYPEPGGRSGSDGRGELSHEVVNWPPILSNNPSEISDHVRRLLSNCLNHHDSCLLQEWPRENEDAREGGELREPFKLPSRVLSVEDNAGDISVKLLETRGLKGTYCALSHCWGSKDKAPLQTTKESFNNHLACIPWGSLPKTFQNAAVLVRNLGIQYLWIDSLCIIQGDKEDWEQEAKNMASIYQKAVLVIAAADSKDPTEGLFGADRPEPLIFRCSTTSPQGVMNNWYVAAATNNGWGLGGPLRERAWAFQEWYLARRKIFFTSEGLKWKCKKEELNERGNDIELYMDETDSWMACLQGYSGKQLTFKSDRIIALLGIAAELRKRRNGSFREDVGVWEDGLAEQLLWRQLERPRDGLDLPSWCWAATGGKKGWLFNYSLHVDEGLEPAMCGTPQTVGLTQSGSIRASGHLMRVSTGSPRLEQCCIEYLRGAFHIKENAMLPDDTQYPESYDIARFPILNVGGNSILGLAIFDNGLHFSECFCFVLLSTKGFYSLTFIYSGKTRLFPCHEICRNYTFGRPPDESRKSYWALLLQPVDGKYQRVGIAMLWQEAVEKTESKIEEFEIV